MQTRSCLHKWILCYGSDVDKYPQVQPDGNRKRGGKRRSGRDDQRCKMRKTDMLSKRYFRICSWNCASANRRSTVLEQMVYDFDVECLKETRTCPNRPLVLQDFTITQRYQGRGKAIVVWSDLSKTVSSLITSISGAQAHAKRNETPLQDSH